MGAIGYAPVKLPESQYQPQMIQYFDPAVDGDPCAWAISKNLKRRHLEIKANGNGWRQKSPTCVAANALTSNLRQICRRLTNQPLPRQCSAFQNAAFAQQLSFAIKASLSFSMPLSKGTSLSASQRKPSRCRRHNSATLPREPKQAPSTLFAR